MPLVLDGTTGFNLPAGAEIGVGTDTPGGNGLHVDHTAGATLRLTRLGTSTSHFVQLETDGAHGTLRSEGNLTLQSGGANPRITVLSTGNVGIGTTTPTAKFDVYDTTTWDTAHFSSNNTVGAGLTLDAIDTGVRWSLIAQGTTGGGNDNNLGFHLTNVGTSGQSTGYKIVMTPSGSIGIGTTSPGAPLTVEGSSFTNDDAIRITRTSETNFGIQPKADGVIDFLANRIDGTSAHGSYNFNTRDGGSTLTRMTINSSGNVGIGTTSPGAKLTMTDEDAGQAMLQVRNYSTAATGGFGNAHSVEFRSATSTTVHGVLIHHNENNIGRRSLDVSDNNGIFASFVQGKVGIGTTSPDVLLDVGNSDSGSAGVAGIQIQNSQDFSTVYDGTNVATFAGIQTVNHDDTSNRTPTGLVFVHRSSSSGIAAIQSTSTAGDRADLRFITRGSGGISEKMIIDDEGDIGMGVAPYSDAKLTLGGTDSGGYPSVLMFDNNNSSGAEFFMLATDTNWSAGSNKFIMGHGTPGSGNMDVTIDSTGNVGIGTASPGVNLEVNASGNTFILVKDRSSGSGLYFKAASGGAAEIQTAGGSNTMGFRTSGQERVHISSGGQVTLGYQPAFDTARPAASSASSNLTGWQNTYVNRGNHFNASNGRFTAPVAGTYLFYGTGIKSGTTTTTMRYYLVKNSSSGWVHDSRHLRLDGGNVNTYGDNGTIQWMVTLAANDWVQAKINGGTIYTATPEYTIFGGYLLG